MSKAVRFDDYGGIEDDMLAVAFRLPASTQRIIEAEC